MFEAIFSLILGAPMPFHSANEAELYNIRQAAYQIFEKEAQQRQLALGDKIPKGVVTSSNPQSGTPVLNFEVYEQYLFNRIYHKDEGLRRFVVKGVLHIETADGKILYFNKHDLPNFRKDNLKGQGNVRALVDIDETGKVVRAEYSLWEILMSDEEPLPSSPMHESFREQYAEYKRVHAIQMAEYKQKRKALAMAREEAEKAKRVESASAEP